MMRKAAKLVVFTLAIAVIVTIVFAWSVLAIIGALTLIAGT